MSRRICPWWLGYFLASPLRRWLRHDPTKILAPYVREGMTVFEPGPGMGFFTLELARRVGASGCPVRFSFLWKPARCRNSAALFCSPNPQDT
jgi:predicted methyltransferase